MPKPGRAANASCLHDALPVTDQSDACRGKRHAALVGGRAAGRLKGRRGLTRDAPNLGAPMTSTVLDENSQHSICALHHCGVSEPDMAGVANHARPLFLTTPRRARGWKGGVNVPAARSPRCHHRFDLFCLQRRCHRSCRSRQLNRWRQCCPSIRCCRLNLMNQSTLLHPWHRVGRVQGLELEPLLWCRGW